LQGETAPQSVGFTAEEVIGYLFGRHVLNTCPVLLMGGQVAGSIASGAAALAICGSWVLVRYIPAHAINL